MTDSNSNINIKLRAMEPEDLDWLYKLENDSAIWNVGITNVPYSRYALHNYIANASNDIYIDKQVRLILVDEAGVSIGIVDLVNFEPCHLRAEVGIVIEKRYRRKGFAMKALQLVKEYAVSILHIHQLFAVIDVSNSASLTLFRKSGYKPSVELKDWLYDGREFRNAVIMQLFL